MKYTFLNFLLPFCLLANIEGNFAAETDLWITINLLQMIIGNQAN